MANHLHDWFRLKHDEGDSTEAGLPVWYRATLTNGAVAPAIAWDDSPLNVLVILVDDVMVVDENWRRALDVLCQEAPDGTLVLPVPVDVSAFRLRFLFGERNRLDAGAYTAHGTTDSEDHIAARARTLRRGVTEAITRELRRPSDDGDKRMPPAPLDVFISHAKRDGRELARQLRDGLADFGQMKTWFDENELPAGYAWSSPMIQAVEAGTAALISVVTDAYPTRPWCRMEVNLARRPREVSSHVPGADDDFPVFSTQPAVAVSQMGGRWSRSMPQLAQVPQLGWKPTEPFSVQAAEVVDRLLLETLLSAFYLRFANALIGDLRRRDTEDAKYALLTWVPDAWSISRVGRALESKDRDCRWVIGYPGHGIRTLELLELQEQLTPNAGGTGTQKFDLVPQERLDNPPQGTTGDKLRVSLSAGGRDADVLASGVGMVQVNDLMERLTRRLLEDGHRLYYGGSLSDYRANLTQRLISTAQGWDRQASDRQASDRQASDLISGETRDDPGRAEDLLDVPLTNYAAWPYYRFISTKQEAELTGICRFIRVDPEKGKPSVDAAEVDMKDPHHIAMCADALTHMRKRAARETDLSIVWAGKKTHWSGWMPGILEEVVCALLERGPSARKLPPLIVGGFGGSAAILSEFLGDPSARWLDEWSFDGFARATPGFAALVTVEEFSRKARRRLAGAKGTLEEYRRKLHDEEEWDFDLDRLRVRDLLGASSPTSVVTGVLGLSRSLTP